MDVTGTKIQFMALCRLSLMRACYIIITVVLVSGLFTIFSNYDAFARSTISTYSHKTDGQCIIRMKAGDKNLSLEGRLAK